MYQSVLGLTLPSFEASESFSTVGPGLEGRIGEGGHRIVYQYGNLAIKVNKPEVVARVRSHKVVLPSWVYSLYRNGFRDFNSAELYNYRSIQALLPDELSDLFMQVYGLAENNGTTISICELLCDYDSKVSKNLQDNGSVLDPKFWERFNQLEQFFILNRIPFFDLKPRNIVVKRVTESTNIPVISDYDQLGHYPYAMQLNFLPDSILRKRINIRFASIIDKYKVKTPSEISQAHSPLQNP